MNKNTPWSTTEEDQAVELRGMGHTYPQIAQQLGRSVKSVEKKFAKLRKLGGILKDPEFPGIKMGLSPAPHPDWKAAPYVGMEPAAEVSAEVYQQRIKACEGEGLELGPGFTKEKTGDRADFWKKEAQRLQSELSNRQHERTAVDILVEKAVELAPKSYYPLHVNFVRVKKGPVSEQSAVLVFSDTHVGQVVKPEQTLGMGGYDFEIFLRRLARLERSIFSILQDHTTSRVPEIVVAMLGDMLHGNLSHAVEAGQVNTLFNQFYSAGHAIAQFLRNLSTIAPVRVHTAVGNHPRWGTQRKMPTDNRYSNLDHFLYAYVAALLRDVPGVSIKLDEQPFSRFDVQGFHFLAGHGDTLRGGDKNLGIPNHAIGRNVSVHSQLAMRSGNPIPNYYLVGHLHRQISLPHCSGEFLVNGGFPGIDGYALAEAFNSSFPSQKFFLMHRKFGRSATYDLRLDLGDETPHTYSLPDGFCCK